MQNGAYSNSRVIYFSPFSDPFIQGGASTALMIAVQKGSYDMIRWLLENGADINAVNTVIIGSDVIVV